MCSALFVNGVPIKSVMLVANNAFFKAGRLMVSSILQGGPSPCILTDWCYSALCSKSIMTPKDIVIPILNSEELTELKKIDEVKSDNELQTVLMTDSALDLLELIGYQGVPSKEKMKNKDLIVKSIYYKLYVEPSIPAIEQLREGMDIYGFADVLHNNPTSFRECFVFNDKNLDIDDFLNLLDPQYSPTGSNRREKELLIYKHFCDMVDECYNDPQELKLENILMFMTGSDKIPEIGFDSKIEIEFLHGCRENCRCFPIASTCALTFTLPVHDYIQSPEIMSQVVLEAVIQGIPFGRV